MTIFSILKVNFLLITLSELLFLPIIFISYFKRNQREKLVNKVWASYFLCASSEKTNFKIIDISIYWNNNFLEGNAYYSFRLNKS